MMAQDKPSSAKMSHKWPKMGSNIAPDGAKMLQNACENRYETLVVEHAFRMVFCGSFGT